MTEADGAGSGGSGARLVVVGGGPGGYPAAFLAAGLGMRVTLIDDGPAPGGVCLHRGCIPSKALLHAAASVGDARRAAEWGVEFGAPAIDLGRLRAWKQGLVDRLAGGLDQLARQHGVGVRARARPLRGRPLGPRRPARGRAGRGPARDRVRPRDRRHRLRPRGAAGPAGLAAACSARTPRSRWSASRSPCS